VPDLAVADVYANVLSILINNGDGTFGAATTIPISLPHPSGIAIADLNGDRKNDLLIRTDTAFRFVPGNGDGTFGPPIDTSVPFTGPNGPYTADLNGDGIPDFVANFYYGNAWGFYLGNGDGTFQPPIIFAGVNGTIAVANVNNDKKSDVLLNTGANIYVYLNTGGGAFAPPMSVPTASGGSILVGDLNGDGNIDIVTGGFWTDPNSGGLVGVLLGNGAGSFSALSSFAGGMPVGLADFNQDGILDLVLANYQSATVSVLQGNGNGSFQPAVNSPSAPFPMGGQGPLSPMIDLNQDGSPDFVVSNFNVYAGPGPSDKVTVYLDKSAPPPALLVSPTTGIAASGIQGEGFSPTSFGYQISSTNGNVAYSISGIPTWLNASFTSGTASSTPVAVTFTLALNGVTPGTYNANIAFTNTTNGRGNITIAAALTVNAGTKDGCKDGGWQNYVSFPGPFKNQGQCVSHFAQQ
jgi:FG-GAP-like repeat